MKKNIYLASFLTLSLVSKGYAQTTDANAQEHEARTSADFDAYSDNFHSAVVVTLPNGEERTIQVTEKDVNKRIPIDDHVVIKEGDTFKYKIKSKYGSQQEGVCDGSVKASTEAIRLKFMRIINNPSKGRGPWFTCTLYYR